MLIISEHLEEQFEDMEHNFTDRQKVAFLEILRIRRDRYCDPDNDQPTRITPAFVEGAVEELSEDLQEAFETYLDAVEERED